MVWFESSNEERSALHDDAIPEASKN
jgi:hypothetical protein